VQTGISKGKIIIKSNYYMVKNTDTEDFPWLTMPESAFPIFPARSGISWPSVQLIAGFFF